MIMRGTIYQINTGSGGVPKYSVASVLVTRERVEGDNWNWWGHGGRTQAICLYSLECLVKLQDQGFPVFPGALGENLTTQGLDYHLINLGDVYAIGDEVRIRITKIRAPCGTIRKAYSPRARKGEGIEAAMWDRDVKQGNTQSPKWGMTGFYAEVLNEGTIRTGDPIERIIEAVMINKS